MFTGNVGAKVGDVNKAGLAWFGIYLSKQEGKDQRRLRTQLNLGRQQFQYTMWAV